jgi:FkbM family methyltransferase
MSLIFKTKRFLLVLSGRMTAIRKSVRIPSAWYGNVYGGFFVNPSLISSQSIVYSFGIGEDISFDRMMIEQHHCQLFAFDPTPKSIQWVKNQQLPQEFHFQEYGLATETGMAEFNLPANDQYVSGSLVSHQKVDATKKVSVPMKSFADIVNDLNHNQIDVLKMDIEGSEFDVLETILNSDVAINQLLIEFHERFFEDGRQRLKRALKLMKQHGYKVFGVSETYEEVSFIHQRCLK